MHLSFHPDVRINDHSDRPRRLRPAERAGRPDPGPAPAGAGAPGADGPGAPGGAAAAPVHREPPPQGAGRSRAGGHSRAKGPATGTGCPPGSSTPRCGGSGWRCGTRWPARRRPGGTASDCSRILAGAASRRRSGSSRPRRASGTGSAGSSSATATELVALLGLLDERLDRGRFRLRHRHGGGRAGSVRRPGHRGG